VSHYALGLPPTDMRAGFPDAAARIRAAQSRLGARALEVALQLDPSLRDRLGETGLRALLRDTEVYLERIARAVASSDPGQVREWADWVAPVYRRRKVPMDDLVTLSEGLRKALSTVLAPEEQASADAALDQAILTFRRYRGLAGDARKRNRILAAIYRGG
jgi:Phycobilisome protein